MYINPIAFLMMAAVVTGWMTPRHQKHVPKPYREHVYLVEGKPCASMVHLRKWYDQPELWAGFLYAADGKIITAPRFSRYMTEPNAEGFVRSRIEEVCR